MTLAAGRLDRRVRIERRLAGEDETGGALDEWELFASRAAGFSPGTGRERREGAQQNASVPGTFWVRRCSLTAQIDEVNFRLRFDRFKRGEPGDTSQIWDITSAVPADRDGIEITAVMKS